MGTRDMASPNTDIAEKMRLMEKRVENLTVRVKEAEEQRDKTDKVLEIIRQCVYLRGMFDIVAAKILYCGFERYDSHVVCYGSSATATA